MIKKTKEIEIEQISEFHDSISTMPLDSKIFVEKSMEIAQHIFMLMLEKNMKQKDLAVKLGKSEAEISKWLTGMHNYTLRSLSKLECALGENIICIPKDKHDVQLHYGARNEGRTMDQNIIRKEPKLNYSKVISIVQKETQIKVEVA